MTPFLKIIIGTFCALFLVQAIKLATDKIKGNFNIRSILTTYGGMPSSHTAAVTSLTTMVGLIEGLGSVAFGISCIFSILVISDAMTLRRHIDEQGRSIQALVATRPLSERSQYPQLYTTLEHTLPQVAVGGLLGFTIAMLIYWLL